MTQDTNQEQQAQQEINKSFDELVKQEIFTTDQRKPILDMIFNEGLVSDLKIDLTWSQHNHVQNLLFKYLDIKNEGKSSPLFDLVTSDENDLKRFLVSSDIGTREMFDFSPIEHT